MDDGVPTIVLNRTSSPSTAFVEARAAELTDEGKHQALERYAVGVGVVLLIIDQDNKKTEKTGKALDDEALDADRRAAARAVLSVMPEYEGLAQEAGIEG